MLLMPRACDGVGMFPRATLQCPLQDRRRLLRIRGTSHLRKDFSLDRVIPAAEDFQA